MLIVHIMLLFLYWRRTASTDLRHGTREHIHRLCVTCNAHAVNEFIRPNRFEEPYLSNTPASVFMTYYPISDLRNAADWRTSLMLISKKKKFCS
ncbi:hypothetical protein EDB81DRAFT_781728, partial [Dactylonectria macrodidyma]